MAEDGKKLSKKLQNYSEPTNLADKVGADAIRFYLLSSPVVRGEDISFSDKEVLELQRKNIGRLHNVLAMYQQFADGTTASAQSENILDRWIVARLNQLIAETTTGFKNYELDKASRPITDFIDDLSVWYLRRSRDRLKGDDNNDKQLALATLRYVLRNLSLVMAPSMPFYAEYLWGQIKEDSDTESVHLGAWPEINSIEESVISEMALTRNLVTKALELRAKSGIKVRQPLGALIVKHELHKDADPYHELIKDEVNVKAVVSDQGQIEEVALDTNITPELKAEGDARDFIRSIQELRKQSGLEASDRITLTVQASQDGEALLEQFKSEIVKTVGAEAILFDRTEGEEVVAGEHSFTVSLTKL